MNDVLTSLGESLTRDYHQQIAAWTETTLIDLSDLSGLFDPEEELLRTAGDWHSLAEIIPTTGFVPQDLLVNPDEAEEAFPQDPQQVVAPQTRKGPSYGFPIAAAAEVFNNIANTAAETGQGGSMRQRVTDNSKPASNRRPEEEDILYSARPKMTYENASEQGQKQSFPVSDIGSESVVEANRRLESPADIEATKLSLQPQAEMGSKTASSLTVEELPTSQKPKDGDSQYAQDTLPTTANNRNTYSDSIWRQQMGGLGDFVSGINNDSAASIKTGAEQPMQGTKAYQAHAAQLVKQSASPIAEDIPNVVSVQQLRQYEPAVDASGAAFTGFQPVAASEPLIMPVQTISTGMENPVFPPQQPDAVLDTEDLLEALTERILRDFRRYYPR